MNNMNDQTNIEYLFIGAVAAALATLVANLVVEVYKNYRKNSDNKKTMSLLLRLEFEACLKYLNELKSSLEDRNQFLFRWLNVLDKSIQSLEGYKSSAYYLQDDDLHEVVASLTTDLSIFVSDTRSIEQFSIDSSLDKKKTPADKKIDEQFIEKQRISKLPELLELKRNVEEVIKKLNK